MKAIDLNTQATQQEDTNSRSDHITYTRTRGIFCFENYTFELVIWALASLFLREEEKRESAACRLAS